MAIEGESLTIFGDGHQTRDFIYVGDVVEAYVTAAGLAESGAGPAAGIYNIGAGGRISVLHLAEVIQSLTGNRKSISFFPQYQPFCNRHRLASQSDFRGRAKAHAPVDAGELTAASVGFRYLGSSCWIRLKCRSLAG